MTSCVLPRYIKINLKSISGLIWCILVLSLRTWRKDIQVRIRYPTKVTKCVHILQVFLFFIGLFYVATLLFTKYNAIIINRIYLGGSKDKLQEKWICLLICCRCRSSRPEVFCKKDVLGNFAKFTGKHLCLSCDFCEISKNSFLQNTSSGCFCRWISCEVTICNGIVF